MAYHIQFLFSNLGASVVICVMKDVGLQALNGFPFKSEGGRSQFFVSTNMIDIPEHHIICLQPLRWHNVVSNHRPFDCLFNSLCGLTSKKHLSPHYWPFVRGIHRWPVNSPHKGPVTRKKLPSDDVIMATFYLDKRSLFNPPPIRFTNEWKLYDDQKDCNDKHN